MNQDQHPTPEEVQEGTIRFIKRSAIGLIAVVATLSAANHLGLFGSEHETPVAQNPVELEHSK